MTKETVETEYYLGPDEALAKATELMSLGKSVRVTRPNDRSDGKFKVEII